MSPTYWTASRIKAAARAHGWEIGQPRAPETSWDVPPWECRKGRQTVVIYERRDGGLLGVTLRYPLYGGTNSDYYGPRCRDKLRTVLDFLCDCEGEKCR